uniref:RING-type domain-containing protein n=1 Tax=Amphimedon queenslandica TaxID=400682 RepID=A0A1X7VUP6_AMPQE
MATCNSGDCSFNEEQDREAAQPINEEEEEPEFIDPVPKEYECPVCLHVLREPHIVSCCGVKVCGPCITRLQYSDQPCPICRQPFNNIMLEKELERKILGLRVHCIHYNKGCEWEGELRNMYKHIDVEKGACGYVKVKCPFGCPGSYQRRETKDHESICTNLPPELQIKRTMRVTEEFKEEFHATLAQFNELCKSESAHIEELVTQCKGGAQKLEHVLESVNLKQIEVDKATTEIISKLQTTFFIEQQEKLRQIFEDMLAKEREEQREKLQELRKEHEIELAKTKSQIENEKKEQMKELQREYQEESRQQMITLMNGLRAEFTQNMAEQRKKCNKEHQQQMEDMKKEFEKREKERLEALKKQYDTEHQKQLIELRKYYEKELKEKYEEEVKEQMQKLEIEYHNQRERQMDTLQKQYYTDREQQLASLKEQYEVSRHRLATEMKQLYEREHQIRMKECKEQCINEHERMKEEYHIQSQDQLKEVRELFGAEKEKQMEEFKGSLIAEKEKLKKSFEKEMERLKRRPPPPQAHRTSLDIVPQAPFSPVVFCERPREEQDIKKPFVGRASSQQSQYDNKKLIIKNISVFETEKNITLSIADILQLDAINDFTLELKSCVAVLTFTNSKTDKEMNDITTNLMKYAFTAERCEHNHSIVITGIRSPYGTEAKLTEYFNDHIRRPVVKKVKILDKNPIWLAKVTFKDHSVIPPIMAAKHEALGPRLFLRIKECSVFDALGISSDLDEISEKEWIKPQNCRQS